MNAFGFMSVLILILNSVLVDPSMGEAIVVHNTWSVFTDNVASVELDDNLVSIYLKYPGIYEDSEISVFTISTYKPSQADAFYDCIVESLREGICVIVLSSKDRAPGYSLVKTNNNNALLTINHKNTIPLSNIGAIHIAENLLIIFLRQPLQSRDGAIKTNFVLTFPTLSERQIFHDKIVLAIFSGDHVYYNDN